MDQPYTFEAEAEAKAVYKQLCKSTGGYFCGVNSYHPKTFSGVFLVNVLGEVKPMRCMYILDKEEHTKYVFLLSLKDYNAIIKDKNHICNIFFILEISGGDTNPDGEVFDTIESYAYEYQEEEEVCVPCEVKSHGIKFTSKGVFLNWALGPSFTYKD